MRWPYYRGLEGRDLKRWWIILPILGQSQAVNCKEICSLNAFDDCRSGPKGDNTRNGSDENYLASAPCCRFSFNFASEQQNCYRVYSQRLV
jgi:hypothetical protein